MSADYWAERARILAERDAANAPEAKPRKPRSQVEPPTAVEPPADSGLNPKE